MTNLRETLKNITRLNNKMLKTQGWNLDEYGGIKNGKRTYENIAGQLANHENCLVGWTEGAGSHFDILFCIAGLKAGPIQGGVKANDLFVSIMGRGAFAFAFDTGELSSGYVEEKLFISPKVTSEGVAELINGVIGAYNKIKKQPKVDRLIINK